MEKSKIIVLTLLFLAGCMGCPSCPMLVIPTEQELRLEKENRQLREIIKGRDPYENYR